MFRWLRRPKTIVMESVQQYAEESIDDNFVCNITSVVWMQQAQSYMVEIAGTNRQNMATLDKMLTNPAVDPSRNLRHVVDLITCAFRENLAAVQRKQNTVFVICSDEVGRFPQVSNQRLVQIILRNGLIESPVFEYDVRSTKCSILRDKFENSDICFRG
jgi:hypothetical protein